MHIVCHNKAEKCTFLGCAWSLNYGFPTGLNVHNLLFHFQAERGYIK